MIVLALLVIAVLLFVLVLSNDKAKSILLNGLGIVGLIVFLAIFGFLVQNAVSQW